MKVFSSNSQNIVDLFTALNNFDQNHKSVMILTCEKNNYDLDELDHFFKNYQLKVFGGVFPGLIWKQKSMMEGYIIAFFDEEVAVDLYQHDQETLYEDKEEYKSIILFGDGLSANIEESVESVFNFYGHDFNYLGGGAGRLSFQRDPCIFTNSGVKKEVTQVVFLKGNLSLGVDHGYEILGDVLRVTESQANRIKTLNYRPAFDVYKEAILNHSKIEINQDNFFEHSKKYPFGICKLGGELIIRDPIECTESDVVCIGQVPENSFVNIVFGEKSKLIEAAKEASIDCHKKTQFDISSRFIVDCISRFLFLENEFEEEAKSFCLDNKPSFGILSIGEIASIDNDGLDFYNKTCVVANLESK